LKVEVPLITRVEGHGHVEIIVDGESLKEVRMGIHEGPRFFESVLVGRRWWEIPEMSARICGICTVIHALAAAKAVEKAAGFSPDETLHNLRFLLAGSAHIQSHILHLYFLALPDYFRVPSALHLPEKVKTHLKEVFRLKRVTNDLTELIGGRRVHPVTVQPGRFTQDVTSEMLKSYLKRMEDIMDGLRFTAEFFTDLEHPYQKVPGHQVALKEAGRLPLLKGEIAYLEGKSFPEERYMDLIEERVLPPNTTKRSHFLGEPFMVGALPRVNIGRDHLRDEVKDIAPKLPSDNLFHNNLAQALECYHFGLEMVEVLKDMVENHKEYVSRRVELTFLKGAEGIGAVEAPRGLLIHHYVFGRDGRVERANVITPTAMNFEHMEVSLNHYLPPLMPQSEDALKWESERLIRAYDPCISCSAHVTRIGELG